MRNPIRRSGVYNSMRNVPLFLVCSLTALAQVRQEPLDAAMQAMWQAHNDGRFQDAAAVREQARDLLQRVPLDSPRYEGWVQQVSQAYQSNGMNAQARAVLQDALARTAPLGSRIPAYAGLLSLLGESWWQDGNLLKAAGYLEQAAAARAAAPVPTGPSTPKVTGIMNAHYFVVTGNFNNTVYAYGRLAELYRQLGRPDAVAGIAAKIRALSPKNDLSLGQFYEQNGQFDEAAAVYRNLAEQSADPPVKANAWQTLANLEDRLQKYPEEAAALREAIAAMETSNRPGFRGQTQWMRQSLARTLGQAGQVDQGDQIFQQLLQESASGPQANQMMVAYAQYLSSTGRAPRAESLLKEYLDGNAGMEAPQQANVLYTLSNMARARGDAGGADAYQKAAQASQPPPPPGPQTGISIAEDVQAAQKAMAQRQYEEAYGHTLRALETAMQARDGQQVGWLVMQVAGALSVNKQGAKADQLFQHLFALAEGRKVETVQPLLAARQNYAQYLMNQPDRAGEVPAAVEEYRRALAEINGQDSGTLAEPLRMQVRFANYPTPTHHLGKAATDLLEMQESLSGNTSEPYLRDLEEVARAYKNSGDAAAAIPLQRKAIALTDLLARPNSPWNRTQIRMETAWTLVELKQYEEGEALAAQAVAMAPPDQAQYLAQQLEQIRRATRTATAKK